MVSRFGHKQREIYGVVLIALLVFTGCKSTVDVTKPSNVTKTALAASPTPTPPPSSANSQSIFPQSLSLTSNQDLIYVSTDFSSPFSAPASGPLATTNNIFALVAAPGLTGPLVNTNVPQAPPGASAATSSAASPSSAPSIIPSYTTYNANISASATFTSAVDSGSKVCEFNSPYNTASCALNSFTIPSNLFVNSTLSAKIYLKDFASNSVSSNSLTTKKYTFKQLTNFLPADNVMTMRHLANYVYFLANNSAGFYKVFRSNGTTVEQISDTYPGADDLPSTNAFMPYNGYLYWGAHYSAASQFKLTRTNGTTLERLSDDRVGASDGMGFNNDYYNGEICNNTLFFWGLDAGGIARHFSFDGANLRQLSNVGGSHEISNTSLQQDACMNNRLYYGSYTGASNRLYSTDGTDFKQVSNSSGGGNDRVTLFFMKVNSKVLFSASTTGAGTGIKLHITDGATVNAESNTCAGCSDQGYSTDPHPVNINGTEVFFAGLNTAAGVTKLFSHDGTTLKQISDTCSGCSDVPAVFTQYATRPGNVAYLSLNTSVGKSKLFKTDGTNLVQISDTLPGGNDAPTSVGFMGNYFFVTLKNSAGFTKLYSYDGSALRQLTDLNPGANDTIYDFYGRLATLNSDVTMTFDGRFYFIGTDSSGATHLYSSNGTDLMQMTGFNTTNGGEFIVPGACGSKKPIMYVNGSKVYFAGVRTDATACNDHLFVMYAP